MAQWNTNTVPKCKDGEFSDEVLVTVEKAGYKGKIYHRVIKAIYVPYHHCDTETMGWCFEDGIPNEYEYIEELDSYWIPQGWYEVSDYVNDYSYSEITDRVIAWSKLQKPYEPRMKDFAEMRCSNET